MILESCGTFGNRLLGCTTLVKVGGNEARLEKWVVSGFWYKFPGIWYNFLGFLSGEKEREGSRE